MAKTIKEINEKIKSGDVVVVNAEEIIDIVKKKGVAKAAREVAFHDENCVVCGLCVKICPFHAMSISL